jgi:DNA-binding transcriptional regulator GbsR (MarR family)
VTVEDQEVKDERQELLRLLGWWQSVYALLPKSLQNTTVELNRMTVEVLERG